MRLNAFLYLSLFEMPPNPLLVNNKNNGKERQKVIHHRKKDIQQKRSNIYSLVIFSDQMGHC